MCILDLQLEGVVNFRRGLVQCYHPAGLHTYLWSVQFRWWWCLEQGGTSYTVLEKNLWCFGVEGNEMQSFNRMKQIFKWSVAILPAGGSVLVPVHSIPWCVLAVPWQPGCLSCKESPGWSIYSTGSSSWKMPLKKWRGHWDLLACISNAPAQTCLSLHIQGGWGRKSAVTAQALWLAEKRVV